MTDNTKVTAICFVAACYRRKFKVIWYKHTPTMWPEVTLTRRGKNPTTGYIVCFGYPLTKNGVLKYVRVRTRAKARKLAMILDSVVKHASSVEDVYEWMSKLDHKFWNVGNKDEFPGSGDLNL